MPRSADPGTFLHTFGQRVRTRRLELGLSQAALAEAADVNPNYPGKVERAQVTPGLEVLVKLADGLRIDPGTLVTGLKPPPRRRY